MIEPAMLSKLAKEVSIDLYYKIECRPAGAYITAMLEEMGNTGQIFIGNAAYQIIECMDRGAIGAMPGPSMFDLYLAVYNRYIEGDREGAKMLHGTVILPMLNHIFQNVEMIIAYEKRILCKRGIIETDYCRQPAFATDPLYDTGFAEYFEIVKDHFCAG